MLVHDPQQAPTYFYIRSLRLQHADSANDDLPATLTNPVPVGRLTVTDSSVLAKDEPRLTPLAGTYTFTDADLSTDPRSQRHPLIKGQFNGLLDRIDVQERRQQPGFSLDLAATRPPSIRTSTPL